MLQYVPLELNKGNELSLKVEVISPKFRTLALLPRNNKEKILLFKYLLTNNFQTCTFNDTSIANLYGCHFRIVISWYSDEKRCH